MRALALLPRNKDNIIRFTDNLCALLINKIKKFGELKKEKTSPPFLILTKWRHLPKLPDRFTFKKWITAWVGEL